MKDVLASFLIIIGLLLVVSSYSSASFIWSLFWPLLLLVPGTYLIIHVLDSHHGSSPWFPLTTGLILVQLGLIFFFHIFSGWAFVSTLAALYPLSFAVAFYGSWRATNKEWLRQSALLWAFLALLSLLVSSGWQRFVLPGLLIVVGFSIITHSRRKRSSH